MFAVLCHGAHNANTADSYVLLSHRRALVNKLSSCSLADGREVERPGTRVVGAPQETQLLRPEESELAGYSGSQLVLLYG